LFRQKQQIRVYEAVYRSRLTCFTGAFSIRNTHISHEGFSAEIGEETEIDMSELKLFGNENDRPVVSNAVIKRLPRYFRYLRELVREGKTRVSSGELSSRMRVTASQIRQDLNCFGGFGQQGYGYNVNYLYAKISEILGVGEGYRAIIIGAGNLGRALVHSSMFERRGVDIIAMFDLKESLFGQRVEDVPIHSIDTLESFCEENPVDIAVLTLPREAAPEVVKRLARIGIPGAWNFTSCPLHDIAGNMTVESVHLGDSLMVLCYDLTRKKRDDGSEEGDLADGDTQT
jgi:redox-sensing transcriptional repressor